MSLVIEHDAAEAESRTTGPAIERAALEATVRAACRRIAPLWPLKHFVAVNPFLGFSGQSFHAAS